MIKNDTTNGSMYLGARGWILLSQSGRKFHIQDKEKMDKDLFVHDKKVSFLYKKPFVLGESIRENWGHYSNE